MAKRWGGSAWHQLDISTVTPELVAISRDGVLAVAWHVDTEPGPRGGNMVMVAARYNR